MCVSVCVCIIVDSTLCHNTLVASIPRYSKTITRSHASSTQNGFVM